MDISSGILIIIVFIVIILVLKISIDFITNIAVN